MVTKLMLTALLGAFVAVLTTEVVRKKRRRPARMLGRVAADLRDAFREGYEHAASAERS